MFDDGVEGERVTPTGAAILKHLNPSFEPRIPPSVILGRGYGFGTKTFPGFSNVLLVSLFDRLQSRAADSSVAVCEFEVDDQTPEDLAIGLERLRELPGIFDVTQAPVIGKKGRLTVRIQVLQDESVPGKSEDEIDEVIQNLIADGLLRARPERDEIPPDPLSAEERKELADRLGRAPGKSASDMVIEDRGE